VAVPSWLFTKCTPLGSPPVLLRLGTGDPEVVTVKENGVPATTVSLVLLVMAHGAASATQKLVVVPVPGVVEVAAVVLVVAAVTGELVDALPTRKPATNIPTTRIAAQSAITKVVERWRLPSGWSATSSNRAFDPSTHDKSLNPVDPPQSSSE
jgi:hypothetical protein